MKKKIFQGIGLILALLVVGLILVEYFFEYSPQPTVIESVISKTHLISEGVEVNGYVHHNFSWYETPTGIDVTASCTNGMEVKQAKVETGCDQTITKDGRTWDHICRPMYWWHTERFSVVVKDLHAFDSCITKITGWNRYYGQH